MCASSTQLRFPLQCVSKEAAVIYIDFDFRDNAVTSKSIRLSRSREQRSLIVVIRRLRRYIHRVTFFRDTI